jgi:hypothetical protein
LCDAIRVDPDIPRREFSGGNLHPLLSIDLHADSNHLGIARGDISIGAFETFFKP